MSNSSKEKQNQEAKRKYRQNAALILERKDKKILICERADYENAWQFPQGGVDKGEDPIDALYREVEEEIGLSPEFYKIIDYREGYRYKFDNRHPKMKSYLGQEQIYFRCRFNGKNKDINLNVSKPEFVSFCWIKPEKFNLMWVPDFKRKVYTEVFRDFYDLDIT